ncbi:hypothetical protein RJ640_004802 [Escallonia rubra]|uniref:Cytokinin riboside 5'-monophosphate phosphoribohydrolase n=1 Tax=Escallonia rubra TaxID=112253 RepID=A0AA88UM13_9ASTE|nr:hypothetical protein RJ640_004802 [Escallonia rubra]
MGFCSAAAISLGSHTLFTSHGRAVKFLSCNIKERHTSNFQFSKVKPHPSRKLSCKLEIEEFEQRTSPNEVLYEFPICFVFAVRDKPKMLSKFCGRVIIIPSQMPDPNCHKAAQVKKEVERCYELIHRLGRGVVYLGSSRMGSLHPHYKQTAELGREAKKKQAYAHACKRVANLLDCTSWSGAGPGLMDAATQGALQAGKLVGGFKIGKEAGEWTATNFHPYLPSDTYLTCRFFSARKHGLVDAVVRSSSSDRTAVVALPGGIGTLDEIFEILALIQLERIGSELPVPFILMNYDSFYSKLLDFLDDCEGWGTLSKGELSSLWKVCNNNSEALAYLAEFYDLSCSGHDRHEVGLVK